MAENTDEEPLNITTDSQSENHSDELTPISETENINLNQETENMEVHKHPHHVTHKKKWGEYFLEFLMLFLAVFLGFIAENIREHKVEKEKGIKYVESFCEDLKTDTIQLTFLINHFKNKTEKINVINECYDSITKNPSYCNCIKDIFLNSQSFAEFNNSDRTLQQLKNSGGLRFLSDADADSVAVYDNMVKGYKLDEKTVVQETQTSLRSIADELFSYSIQKSNTFLEKNIFVTTDKGLINKYFNTLKRYHNYCKKNYKSLEKIKLKAVSVRNYFLNKYHFE